MPIYEQVDVGVSANDTTGDSFRASFIKINSNFTLLEVLGINAQVGAAYETTIDDARLMITMANAGANVVTIPANSAVAYPIGTEIHFMQIGAGATSIAITTDTLNVAPSLSLVLREQYAVATALKIGATEWVLFGSLT